jgi:hypothetical protein
LAKAVDHFFWNITLPIRYEWIEQLNMLTKHTHQITNMKTKIISKILLTLALVLVLGSAVTPVHGDTQPSSPSVIGSPDRQFPVVTIQSTDNVTRGNIGTFVLSENSKILLATTFVNFSVSGTAISGVDYTPLIPPVSIGQSGFGVLLVKTLPDPRASVVPQAHSVVITLEPGLGYAVGEPSAAEMFIKP